MKYGLTVTCVAVILIIVAWLFGLKCGRKQVSDWKEQFNHANMYVNNDWDYCPYCGERLSESED